ncbi:MAG: PQ-loop domain-containing transporter [Sarcina sp.]
MQVWGQIFQVLGSILLLYSYVPQVISLIKSKNANGISTQFWFILTIGLGCVAANMAISGVPMLMLLTQIANTICALVTLVLVMKYKNIESIKN